MAISAMVLEQLANHTWWSSVLVAHSVCERERERESVCEREREEGVCLCYLEYSAYMYISHVCMLNDTMHVEIHEYVHIPHANIVMQVNCYFILTAHLHSL